MPQKNLEETIDEFEQGWSGLTRDEVVEFVDNHRSDDDTLLELVHTDMELRLKSGDSARVEEYLERWPELRISTNDLVLAEFTIRERREPDLAIDEFIERFPECAIALIDRFDGNSFKMLNQQSEGSKHGGFYDRSYATERFSMEALHAEGGLGNVWLAHDHQLSRTVALKEIKNRHANNPEHQSRFLQEAKITGMLDHPGIVPIHSAGTFRDGRPYYTMRMIRGKSLRDGISEFHSRYKATKHQPEFRRLLQHFVDVCKTIEFAHSRNVIHRDVKPGNIMIGEYGETLVVDWGLAKILPEYSSQQGVPGDTKRLAVEESESTVVGQVIGSPAFMSPEQAVGSPHEIGKASDIYNLGATLYYLIANRPRILATEWNAFTSEKRDSLKRQMNPLLAVCARAMAWQANDRFVSAGELANDVECFLDDSPVTAHRESKTETLERLARRNQNVVRTVVLATGVIALVSTLAAVLINFERRNATELANEATIQSQAAKDARQQAIAARDASDEFVDLLSDVFILSGPANRGRQFDFHDHVEKFRLSIQGKEPLVEAKGRATLGRLFAAGGDYLDAINHFDEALELYQDGNLEGSLEYLSVLVMLGQTCFDSNHIPRAREIAEEAARMEAIVEIVDEMTMMELQSLRSQIAGSQQDYLDSIRFAEEALDIAEARLQTSSSHDMALTTWIILTNRLAGQLIKAGGRLNMRAADRHLQNASDAQMEYGHSTTRAAITTLNNRGIWYRQEGRYEEFIDVCRKVVEVREKILGADDRETLQANSVLGSSLLNLVNSGEPKNLRENIEEAIQVLESTFSKQADTIGRDNVDTATTAVFLATAWRRQLALGPDESVDLEPRFSMLSETVEASERRFGPENLLVLRLKSQLAMLYQKSGYMDKAAQIFSDVSRNLKSLWDNNNDTHSSQPIPGKVLELMSSCSAHFVVRGKYEEAIGMLSALVDSDERNGQTSPKRNYMLGLCLLHCRKEGDHRRLEMAAQRLESACSGLAIEYRNRSTMPPVELNANRIFLQILKYLEQERRAAEHLDVASSSGRLSEKQLQVLSAEVQ